MQTKLTIITDISLKFKCLIRTSGNIRLCYIVCTFLNTFQVIFQRTIFTVSHSSEKIRSNGTIVGTAGPVFKVYPDICLQSFCYKPKILLHFNDCIQCIRILLLIRSHHLRIRIRIEIVRTLIIRSIADIRITRLRRISCRESYRSSRQNHFKQISTIDIRPFVLTDLSIHIHPDCHCGGQLIGDIILERIIHDINIIVPRISFLRIQQTTIVADIQAHIILHFCTSSRYIDIGTLRHCHLFENDILPIHIRIYIRIYPITGQLDPSVRIQ